MSTPPLPREVLAQLPTGLLVDGQWRPSSTGATFAVEDPATTEVVTEVADASADDALAALDATSRAFEEWRAAAPRERAEALRAGFDRMAARAEELAAGVTARSEERRVGREI